MYQRSRHCLPSRPPRSRAICGQEAAGRQAEASRHPDRGARSGEGTRSRPACKGRAWHPVPQAQTRGAVAAAAPAGSPCSTSRPPARRGRAPVVAGPRRRLFAMRPGFLAALLAAAAPGRGKGGGRRQTTEAPPERCPGKAGAPGAARVAHLDRLGAVKLGPAGSHALGGSSVSDGRSDALPICRPEDINGITQACVLAGAPLLPGCTDIVRDVSARRSRRCPCVGRGDPWLALPRTRARLPRGTSTAHGLACASHGLMHQRVGSRCRGQARGRDRRSLAPGQPDSPLSVARKGHRWLHGLRRVFLVDPFPWPSGGLAARRGYSSGRTGRRLGSLGRPPAPAVCHKPASGGANAAGVGLVSERC